jgi:hypothetical protein
MLLALLKRLPRLYHTVIRQEEISQIYNNRCSCNTILKVCKKIKNLKIDPQSTWSLSSVMTTKTKPNTMGTKWTLSKILSTSHEQTGSYVKSREECKNFEFLRKIDRKKLHLLNLAILPIDASFKPRNSKFLFQFVYRYRVPGTL